MREFFDRIEARPLTDEQRRAVVVDEAAAGMTVRTFHSLGMAIIGEAEGRRPALAKAAEDEKALIDLLKSIVAELIADRKLSVKILSWFQEQFAPYRSQHDFRNWGEYWDSLLSG